MEGIVKIIIDNINLADHYCRSCRSKNIAIRYRCLDNIDNSESNHNNM